MKFFKKLSKALKTLVILSEISIQSKDALEVVVSENLPVDDKNKLNRLRMLAKFTMLAGKAREIELEWQRIQQDEHDFKFAFETSPQEESQAKYLYKKGIADGVKWCLKNFS